MTKNEKKDSLRYAGYFARDILKGIVLYIILTFILPSLFQNSIWLAGVSKIILLLYYCIKQDQLLKRVRRFSKSESPSIKAVYWCYLITMFCFAAISYCKNDIVELFNPVLSMPLEWIKESESTIGDTFNVVYNALLILKTSIEIVIIKDVIYQMNNWNIHKSFSDYFGEMVHAGKIYILQEDKKKPVPRLWFIRGDACVDLVDSLLDYQIKKDDKFEIKLTEKQEEELINKRKQKGVYDENDCLDTDNPAINLIVDPILFIHDKIKKIDRPKKIHEYFFDFSMMDLSYYEDEYIKQDILEKYRSELLELPKNTRVDKRKSIRDKILKALFTNGTVT